MRNRRARRSCPRGTRSRRSDPRCRRAAGACRSRATRPARRSWRTATTRLALSSASAITSATTPTQNASRSGGSSSASAPSQIDTAPPATNIPIAATSAQSSGRGGSRRVDRIGRAAARAHGEEQDRLVRGVGDGVEGLREQRRASGQRRGRPPWRSRPSCSPPARRARWPGSARPRRCAAGGRRTRGRGCPDGRGTTPGAPPSSRRMRAGAVQLTRPTSFRS